MSDLLAVVAATARALPPIRGRGRLAQLLFERSRRQGTWDIAMRGGYRMVVPRSSRQGWAAAFTGRYDEDRLSVVLDHVTPGSTVLDVGASLGFWTLMLAARTPASHVVAYEPLAANRTVIEGNVARNALGAKVLVEPWALGAEDAEALAATESGGAGNAAVVTGGADGHLDLPDRVAISVRTLDAMAPTPSRCSFVKIDVEGYELAALAGAERFVADHRPAILGEFSPFWSHERGVPDDGATSWAAAHDYEVLEVRPVRRRLAESRRCELHQLSAGREHGSGDLLLLPRP